MPTATKSIDAITNPILCLKTNANKAYINQTATARPKIFAITFPPFDIPNWDILIIPKWYNDVKRFS